MKLFSKLAAAAVVTTLAVGGGATAASAYSISGGAYTSVPTNGLSITVGGGVYTVGCTATSFSGSATGTDTISFTPALSGCDFFGFPVNVTQSGNWNIKVTSGGPSWYYGELELPAGSTMTWNIPLMGCTFTFAGPQTFANGVGNNVLQLQNGGTGVDLDFFLESVAYTASGCPFWSGSDGFIDSGISAGRGPIQLPGLTVS